MYIGSYLETLASQTSSHILTNDWFKIGQLRPPWVRFCATNKGKCKVLVAQPERNAPHQKKEPPIFQGEAEDSPPIVPPPYVSTAPPQVAEGPHLPGSPPPSLSPPSPDDPEVVIPLWPGTQELMSRQAPPISSGTSYPSATNALRRDLGTPVPCCWWNPQRGGTCLLPPAFLHDWSSQLEVFHLLILWKALSADQSPRVHFSDPLPHLGKLLAAVPHLIQYGGTPMNHNRGKKMVSGQCSREPSGRRNLPWRRALLGHWKKKK